MSWRTALFESGKMGIKNTLFFSQSREAHDRITSLLILTYPALAGAWQFRNTTKHFAHLANPVPVRDAVLSFMEFPTNETAIRRMDLRESVTNITWQRQRDAVGEMMFLVSCSIFENFTGAVQDMVAPGASSRIIEKGFQFPSEAIDFATIPPARSRTSSQDHWQRAMTLLPSSPFMISRILPSFPVDTNNRSILSDFEEKMQTYLLFKKFRNTIVHGNFDNKIPHCFRVVDEVVSKEALGLRTKPSISFVDSQYFLTFYNVVGFVGLLLSIIRDIDRFCTLSSHGEVELLRRLAAQRESKLSASGNRTKEFARLKKCVTSLGLPTFIADQAAIDHLVSKQVWRS
ncbi:MAG: hypothetical protein ACOVN0_16935 [Niveispirillum sp.]|uniref:hypothetical protein n=1 Tax=Niveispirillum sp. TaxID=1917217 RepID=UPI003BA56570